MITLIIVQSLLVAVSSAAAAEPLLMDIEWVMQGFTFDFQGFMVEFLGVSSGIRRLMPFTRLVQSSFRENFGESPVLNATRYFGEEMFSTEGENARWLHERTTPNVILPEPRSSVFPPVSIDVQQICEADDDFEHNSAFVEGNLARNMAKSSTSKDCCMKCAQNRLCVGWTFEAASESCFLKGAIKYDVVSAGHVSGRFARRGGRVPLPKALIMHGTTCYHQNLTVTRTDANTILIGRYMLEREHLIGGVNLDEMFVTSCAMRMDEVWVPTDWNKKIFERFLRNQGNPNPQVFVIPEAVDTLSFNPSLGDRQRFRKFFLCPADTCPASSQEPFVFLSIFKWEYRKGWDVMLRAYWKAFSKEDNVVLWVRSYVPSFSSGDENILSRIENFANLEFNKSLSELARVEWVKGFRPEDRASALTRADMRDLLAAADAFVLPTRGEGWGLPVAEAMAMELPVIVTNHSGPTAFTNESNAYLIPVLNGLDSSGFGRPDEEALVGLFRDVARDSSTADDDTGISLAKKRGVAARKRMEELSPDYVAELMAERLRSQARIRMWEL